MAQAPGSLPIRPLSIGNVVSAGLRLYRSNLKTYLKISLFAHLWLVLWLVSFLWLAIYGWTNSFAPLWFVLWFVSFLWLAIYGCTKYLMNAGLISRLAFGELVDQPESVNTARSKTRSRMWSFLRVGLQILLMMTLVYIGLAIATGIVMAIAVGFGVALGSAVGESPILIGLIFLLSIAAVIGFLYTIIWFYSHWMVADVSLAVEDDITGGQSIDRSWQLTQNSILRIQGVAFVAFLITLPLVFLTSYMPQIFLISLDPESALYMALYSASLLFGVFVGVLTMPFWQAIKAVVYYDLRSRREGMGLQLRNRQVAPEDGLF